MSVFDPYGRDQPTVPGLNTGSTAQISTLAPVDTDGIRSDQYRSGALSALAPFLGWLSLILSAVMGAAGAAGRALCLDGQVSADVCTMPTNQLVLAPIGVLFFGLVLAAIGGGLTKKRRAFPAAVVLLVGFALLGLATSWFGTALGLPFP